MRTVDAEGWEELVSTGGIDGPLAQCFDEVVSTMPEKNVHELRMGNELIFQGECELVKDQGELILQLIDYGAVRRAKIAAGEQLPPVLIHGGKTRGAVLFAAVMSRRRMKVDRLSFGIPRQDRLRHLELIVEESNVRAQLEADALARLATLIAKMPAMLSTTPVQWVPDRCAAHCSSCHVGFTFFCRRHHCRGCGGLFCAHCTSQSRVLVASPNNGPQRVCRECAELRDCISSPLTNPSVASSTPDPTAISNTSSIYTME